MADDVMDAIDLEPTGTEPTPAPTPAPPSAQHAAIAQKDFRAFRVAQRAEEAGTPVEAPAEPAAPAAEPETAKAPENRGPRRTMSQEKLNDLIRQSVERAQQPLLQQIAELKAGRTPEPAHAAEPDWKRYAAMPGYPKVSEFDSLEEHAAAASLFVQRAQAAERQQLEQQTARSQDLQQAITGYRERMQAALADQGFAEDTGLQFLADGSAHFAKLPALSTAVPLSALSPQDIAGGKATFANVTAEALLRSDAPDKLFRYLATHPDEVTRIGGLPSGQWLSALSRLDGRLTTPPPAPAPVPAGSRSVTRPPTTLGTRASAPMDPEKAALARRDFSAYRSARRAARLAERV